MRILITGPDGVLGSNLIRELLKRKYDVLAFVEKGKPSPCLDGLKITKFEGDLLNLEDVLLASSQADYIIHCGAMTSVVPARDERVKAVNVKGTHNVVLAAKMLKVKRMIYVGSANSFASGCKDHPGNEGMPFDGFVYGLDYIDSKYEAMKEVLNAVEIDGLDALVVNPTFMIGAYDSRPSSGTLILNVCKNKVPAFTEGGKNFVDVKDVAIAIANALQMGRKGECYILGNENLNFQEFFSKIATVTGRKCPKYKLRKSLLFIAARCSELMSVLRSRPLKLSYPVAVLASEEKYYSASKAVKELAMPQTPIESAIKDCYEWFIENRYIKK